LTTEWSRPEEGGGGGLPLSSQVFILSNLLEDSLDSGLPNKQIIKEELDRYKEILDIIETLQSSSIRLEGGTFKSKRKRSKSIRKYKRHSVIALAR